jgi:hypothetical protein
VSGGKKKKQKAGRRFVYFQVQTLSDPELPMCESACGRAAVWEIRWTYEEENEDDLDWAQLCTECLPAKVDLVMQRR